MVYSILLAFVISIDSFGIGITYGMKNTKLNFMAIAIIFVISMLISYISIFLGSIFAAFIGSSFSYLLGPAILIFMGLWIIFHKQEDLDFDHSNSIDAKEACFLGLVLSMDAISISFGIGNMDINYIFFPVFVSLFNISFLIIGKYISNIIRIKLRISDNFWNIFSGLILIILGFFKLF